MPRRCVFAMGMEGFGVLLKRHGASVLCVREIERLPRIADPGSVLLLGDIAMGALRPEEVLPLTRPPAWEVLACPVRSPPGLVARWGSWPEVMVVRALEAIPARLEEARQVPVRRIPSLESWAGDWLRRCSCGNCTRILRVVEHLRVLRRAAWAERLGVGERHLWHTLRSCSGVCPKEALAAFQRAVIALEEAEGWPRRRISESVPYSEPRNLRRAHPGLMAPAAGWNVDNLHEMPSPLPLTAFRGDRGIPPSRGSLGRGRKGQWPTARTRGKVTRRRPGVTGRTTGADG